MSIALLVSLVLLGLSLAFTALNKSGISPVSCYVSLVITGLAFIVYWSRPRRVICPPLPRWLMWTIRGIFLYLIFQAIPLPLSLLSLLSPERANLTRSLVPILGKVSAAPISVDPAAHVLWLLTMVGGAATFFLVREIAFRLQNRIFIALLPLFCVAVFEALLGLLQVAAGAEQAVGSYNSRDHYCCILEMTLPLLIAFGFVFFSRKSAAPSVWPTIQASGCWLAATFLVLGILFSLSRAGWIDSLVSLLILASLLIFPKMKSNRWRIGILGGSVVLLSLLFLLASPSAMLSRLAGSIGNDSSGRLYIWHDLIPLTHQFRWFGTGLMGFDPVFLRYQTFINDKRIDFAHDDFLQYLIEMGIIGFVPLLLSIAAITTPIAKRACMSRSTMEDSSTSNLEFRIILSGCIAGTSALFLHSLVDFNLYIPANLLSFAWILGFGSALCCVVDSRTKQLSSVEQVPE